MTASQTSNFDPHVESLIESAIELSRDYGPDVMEAVRLAVEQPLDTVTATRLYTRILEMLRARGRQLDDDDRRQLAEDVGREVSELVDSRPRPAPSSPHLAAPGAPGGLKWVDRNGLSPHPVVPVPSFAGQTIPMWEGYVDVNDLSLWQENHRVELFVQEFEERNGRKPDHAELLLLMQGTLDDLPSLRDQKDPFGIVPLARSIARKGVERPPIVTWDGEPKDGNRRITASKYVLASDQFTAQEKENARWIRVWQAPYGTTEDQFESIVVARNFEPEYREPWPEYVKGRLVVQRYRARRDDFPGMLTEAQKKRLREEVAKAFAITPSEVLRYLRMVQWAEDFESYHVDERGKDVAKVRYKANDVFQWFYEIQAGKTGTKLTEQLEKDEDLRPVVYDLMFDVLNSGAQVRELHSVVADPAAMKLLQQAHDEAGKDHTDQALAWVNEAIAEAKRKSPTKRLGFEQWLRGAVERFGTTSPEDWRKIQDSGLLTELRRVLPSAIGAIDGELVNRGFTVPTTPSAEAS
jgi:hypothetical protein